MRKQRSFLHNSLVDGSPEVVGGKGKNLIPPPEREPLWKAYFEKFKDPLIVVLLVVFCFSVLVSSYEAFYLHEGLKMLIEPLGILVALLLATGVGFIFEVKAGREFDVLNAVKDQRPVKVYRRYQAGAREVAKLREVKKHDVCLGDYVYVESGDEIPADGILLETNDLMIDESNFTGEPYAKKHEAPQVYDEATGRTITDELSDDEATFPPNKVLRGSTVIQGDAIFVVTSIGMDTIEGHGVAKVQEGSDVQTPLNRQLKRLGTFVSRASFIIATLVVVGRLVYFFHVDSTPTTIEFIQFLIASFMIAVTLVVCAVPEGLPMSVTVSLALSMRKMLKENNLVRKLHACETMGAATVICTDKTGTLTQNKMTVVEHEFYGDGVDSRIGLNIALNSTAEISLDDDGRERPLGNPTEGALIVWLKGLGTDYADLRSRYDAVSKVPFSTERKYMETELSIKEEYEAATPGAERHVCLVKGAPEVVLGMCQTIGGGQTRDHILSVLSAYQAKAMRTLAFASRHEENGQWTPLTFDGIVGIADPIRPDVKDAISKCTKRAGVRVIIVTGDTQGTANEIGREVGLIAPGEQPQTMTGAEFEALPDEKALKVVEDPNFKIISRARPDDKARLVTLLQRQNEVVAVTGDGTNDAPALSKAQVGLSMGDGTSRAKEASDITIIDNSFSSIVRAIVWGRSLYLNIQRFILFQMTVNICACFIVLVGAFTGIDSPLTVTQMLWVNLIMDTFAAMALSSLPADERVLDNKPRNPNAFIIDRLMGGRIVWVGLAFFLVLFCLWQLLWHTDVSASTGVASLFTVDNLHIALSRFFDFAQKKPHMSSYEMGIFFSFFVMMQFWNLFNAKYFRTNRSLLQDLCGLFVHPRLVVQSYSRGFLFIVAVILIGQVLIVNLAGDMFNVSALTARDWLIIIFSTSLVLLVPDVFRCLSNLLAMRREKAAAE